MARRALWGRKYAGSIPARSTMKPRYSGDKSKRFWRRVNAIENEAERKVLYQLGRELQSLEEDVVRKLKAARKKAKNR